MCLDLKLELGLPGQKKKKKPDEQTNFLLKNKKQPNGKAKVCLVEANRKIRNGKSVMTARYKQMPVKKRRTKD